MISLLYTLQNYGQDSLLSTEIIIDLKVSISAQFPKQEYYSN